VRSAAQRAVLAAALACAAGGCAYFNAMYNADHYAHQAEADERAGRSGDARTNWQLAEAHAETLVVHHPKSGWVGKAQLLRGRALVSLTDYSDAQVALQEALRHRLSTADRLEALGLLGRSLLVYHHLDSAAVALDSAATSRERAVRDAALLDRGRIWLERGQPDSARAAFRRSAHPLAAYALAAADVAVGDTAAAGAVYDSLAGVKAFAEAAWRPALDSLAAAGDRAHASRLVARLTGRRGIPAGAAARLLLDEGDRRLAAGDSSGAAAAWLAVDRVARDSVEGQTAAVSLARLAVATAASDTVLGRQRDLLLELTRGGGGAGRDAASLLRLLDRADSLGRFATAPDAHWFMRAELLRDSLGAVRLAASDFAAMASLFPDSPWTPKGLVAAIAAGYPEPDSLQGLLLHRYAGSPYVVAAAGGVGSTAALASLEDSLRTVLASSMPAGGRTGGAGFADVGVGDERLAAREPGRGQAEPQVDRAPDRPQAPGVGVARAVRPPEPPPPAAPPPSAVQPLRPPYGPPGPELPE